MKATSIKQYLTATQLEAVADRIRAAEKSTRGEIRLSIIRKRSWLERKLSPEQLALKEFRRLGMHRTKERTGILLLVLLQERAFHILADEGINSGVEGNPWEQIASSLSTRFREEKYEEGLCEAIGEIGHILSRVVPQQEGDKNELPNTVALR